MVKGWKKKIIIGSNENEDKYKDKDFVVNGEGKIEIKWKNESGDKKEIVKNVNE
jgi:isocitrate dehydrogenase